VPIGKRLLFLLGLGLSLISLGLLAHRLQSAHHRLGVAFNPANPQASRPSLPANPTAGSSITTPRRLKVAYPPEILITEPVFQKFNTWAERFLNAPAAEHPSLEVEGMKLAEERRGKMLDLIQTHPDRAIELAFPRAQRLLLPASVVNSMEEPVRGRGDLAVLGVLAREGETVTPVIRKATIGETTYDAFVYGRRLGEPTRTNLALVGIALEKSLALEEYPARTLGPDEVATLAGSGAIAADAVCQVSGQLAASLAEETVLDHDGEIIPLCSHAHAQRLKDELAAAEAANGYVTEGSVPGTAASAYTEGTKNLLILRVDFSDIAGGPFTLTTATNLVNGLNSFYRTMSYQKAGFNPLGAGSEVTPVLRMPQTAAYYGNTDASILRTDARNAAATAGYALGNFDFDLTCFANISGFNFSGLGYVGAPGVWINGSSAVGVAAHELGHNFGLNHANFWDTSGQSVIGSGASVEYGDKFDTMGNAIAGSTHFNARYKSYLNWLTSSDVKTISQSGIYRLFAHDDPAGTGIRALKIVRTSGTNYWLEYRTHFSGNKWLPEGVGIRWAGNGNQSALLLDTTPGSANTQLDSPLRIGRTFSDLAAGIHITPIGKGGTTPESLDIVVNKGSFATNLPPVILVVTPITNSSVNVPLAFSVTATDPNGDPLAYSWDFGDGAFGSNSLNTTHAWTASGDYVVHCTVSDMKGGLASQSTVVRIGTPATYSLSGRVLLGSDPLDGVRVFVTSTRQAFTDSDGRYYITGLPAGAYIVQASRDGYVFIKSGFDNPVSIGPSRATIDFFALLSNDQTADPLIAQGSIWEYLDNGSDQGTGWRALDFDDSTWKSGAAPLGYGDSSDKTVVQYGPSSNNKFITTYFRKKFNIDDRRTVLGLTLGLRRDDGAVAFLNDHEVFRSNMAAGVYNYLTLAQTAVGGVDETTFFEQSIDPALLQNGPNIMTVEIHQVNRTSSDIVFDLRLAGISSDELPAPQLSWEIVSGSLNLKWPESAVTWSLFGNTDLQNPSGWSAVNAAIRLLNGQRSATVTIGSDTFQYFRLQRIP
jgi:PKD repeat protein